MRTMSVVTFCIIISIVSKGQSQTKSINKFVLKVEIAGRDTGTAILWYNDADNIVQADTAHMNNGKFLFSGTTNKVCEALLWVDPSQREFDNPCMIRFLLEPKTITIKGTKGNEAKSSIKGSISQTEKENWDEQKAMLINAKTKYKKRSDSLYRLSKSTGLEFVKTLLVSENEKVDSIIERITEKDLTYIQKHPTSFLSAYLLSKYVRKLPIDSLQFYYTLLSTKVKQSAVAHDVLAALYPLTNDNEFRKANPLVDSIFDERLRNIHSVLDLSLRDTSGHTVFLNTFKGRYLVIDFWGKGCQPCIENIPALNKFIGSISSDSIVFISVSLDKDINDWKETIRRYNFKGLHLSDLNGFSGLAPIYCKVLWVPRYVIVNRDGEIINYQAPNPRNPDFAKLIEGLLKNYYND